MQNNITDKAEKIKEEIIVPVIALKNIVLLEKFIIPLFIENPNFVSVIDTVMKNDRKIFVVTQKNFNSKEISTNDLFKIGVYVNILQYLKLPDGTIKLLVEGIRRGELKEITDTKKDGLFAKIVLLDDINTKFSKKQQTEIANLNHVVIEKFKEYMQIKSDIPASILETLEVNQDSISIIFNMLFHMDIKVENKQKILELNNIKSRLQYIYELLEKELEFFQIDSKIKNRVKKQIDKSQRDFYLNEQIKAIQKEMGRDDDDVEEIEKKLSDKKPPEYVRKKIESEISKLKKTQMISAEAGVIRNYIDWLLDVPWHKKEDINQDIAHAEKILNEEHYALDKVKDRVLEYLAVHKRSGKNQGSILCLIGPPGVGKTSLGKTIAKALGRDFVRVSLGGVKDEAEIRGHRRTYIGSMPGCIIQSIKKTEHNNPVMLLDEIDKMGADWKGDPSSAMLEVLDPEQNKTFNDHYLDVDYDLSNVMFITTANSYDIPRPLLDRMEIINIEGYTEDEKIEIAIKHIIPKQRKIHLLNETDFNIDREAIRNIIRYYTREAGVRELERVITKIMRKIVLQLESSKPIQNKKIKTEKTLFDDIVTPIKSILKKKHGVVVTVDNLSDFLGIRKFDFGTVKEIAEVGVVNGLAWTGVGGDILTIESVQMFGKGKCTLTGHLGDVMKESIQTAHSFVKSNANAFGISAKLFDRIDIHVHVPEGATPKDGPSAGVAMSVSMVSMLTGIPIKKDIAMTGEITLRGRVLPIGGLKEKLLAALRGGIKTVLIPKENEKDLEEIPEIIKKGLKIITIKDAKEALGYALINKINPITEHLTDTDFVIKHNDEILESA